MSPSNKYIIYIKKLLCYLSVNADIIYNLIRKKNMKNQPITADDLDGLPTHSIVACQEQYGRCYVAIKHADKWAVSGYKERMTSEEVVSLTEGKEILRILEIGHEH